LYRRRAASEEMLEQNASPPTHITVDEDKA
jgi:hypothetical protein